VSDSTGKLDSHCMDRRAKRQCELSLVGHTAHPLICLGVWRPAATCPDSDEFRRPCTTEGGIVALQWWLCDCPCARISMDDLPASFGSMVRDCELLRSESFDDY
jgi:hypothetical protein